VTKGDTLSYFGLDKLDKITNGYLNLKLSVQWGYPNLLSRWWESWKVEPHRPWRSAKGDGTDMTTRLQYGGTTLSRWVITLEERSISLSRIGL
jgi:hypothetical protein